MSLRQFSWRAMWRRPGRTVLTLLSIVIGVAAVVSISVTAATTRNAYGDMFSLVTGRTSLVVDGEAGAAIDETLRDEMAQQPDVAAAVPIIQRYTSMFAHNERLRIQFLGVTPELEQQVRTYELVSGRQLGERRELLIDTGLAEHLQVGVGDEVRLLTKLGIKPVPFQIAGLVRPSGGVSLNQAGLVLMPLRVAQSLFAGRGKIDAVQIVLREGAEEEAAQAQLAGLLPAGVRVHRPTNNTQVMQDTLLGSELGLRLTTAFALLLAAFIILNTFQMNVSERRRQLAILRAIGATRSQIAWTILSESILLGATGTAVGIVVGLGAAAAVNELLRTTLDVPLPTMVLSRWPFVWAVVFGCGVSVIGALLPAFHAGRISPLEGLDRAPREKRSASVFVWAALGIALIVGSSAVIVAAILGYLSVDVAIGSAVFFIVGFVLFWPLILAPLTRLVFAAFGRLCPTESNLAMRQVLRHRVRSSLTVGVLFVASSTGIGMSTTILDSVNDVRRWYQTVIIGDYFIRATIPDFATGDSGDMPDPLVAALRQVPGVTMLEGVSFLESRMGDINVQVVARDLPQTDIPIDLMSGDMATVRRQLFEGQAVVGSVLAGRLGLKVGDEIPLQTPHGERRLRVCGIANDYMGGGMSVVLQRDVAAPMLDLTGYDAFSVKGAPHEREEVERRLRTLCDEHGVLLHSFQQITARIDAMILGIDGCLWGLVALGFIVAAFGLVNTLSMNVLEQTREIGLLRLVAMTKRQVRRTILVQAMLLGFLGVATGVIAGLGVAYLMNLTMWEAIGHEIALGFHPWLLAITLFGASVLTGLAGWLPARKAANINMIEALHYE